MRFLIGYSVLQGISGIKEQDFHLDEDKMLLKKGEKYRIMDVGVVFAI